MNLQAAKEIARQLRLRDLGGVIVNDFIDMREEKHRRGVEKAMRDAVKRDRARTKVLKISAFGLIEMTRQRIRPSLKRSVYQDCPHCHNTGQVKTCESMSIDVMRMIQLAAHRENIARVQIKVADDVANYLLNKKRKEIARLEEAGEIALTITGQAGVSPETLDFVCFDNNNNEVKFLTFEEPARPRRR
jgi:ribonuclease E